MAKKKRENRRKDVRKSLIEQLKSKGADEAMFMDQVEDYMTFWDQKETLKEMVTVLAEMLRDINEDPDWPIEDRVRTVLDTNRQIMEGNKQLRDTNRQMLSVLKAMDITTDKIIKKDGDMDEL